MLNLAKLGWSLLSKEEQAMLLKYLIEYLKQHGPVPDENNQASSDCNSAVNARTDEEVAGSSELRV